MRPPPLRQWRTPHPARAEHLPGSPGARQASSPPTVHRTAEIRPKYYAIKWHLCGRCRRDAGGSAPSPQISGASSPTGGPTRPCTGFRQDGPQGGKQARPPPGLGRCPHLLRCPAGFPPSQAVWKGRSRARGSRPARGSPTGRPASGRDAAGCGDRSRLNPPSTAEHLKVAHRAIDLPQGGCATGWRIRSPCPPCGMETCGTDPVPSRCRRDSPRVHQP